jgi:predicted DNA-binding transcriptional regulator AlpA
MCAIQHRSDGRLCRFVDPKKEQEYNIMNEELQRLLEQPTASVPEVRRIALGMSRNAAYSAVRNGTFPFPVIVAGGRVLVPTVNIRRLLVEGAAS